MKTQLLALAGAMVITAVTLATAGQDQPEIFSKECGGAGYQMAAVDFEAAKKALTPEGRLLKPLRIRPFAHHYWNCTGIKFKPGELCVIEYVDGQWSIDPEAKGFHGPEGNAHYAPDSYIVPSRPQGCLLVKFGVEGRPMVVASRYASLLVQAPPPQTAVLKGGPSTNQVKGVKTAAPKGGAVQTNEVNKPTELLELFITPNDDLPKKYGSGYDDNKGFLHLQISVQNRK
jgi:hypothetical protein